MYLFSLPAEIESAYSVYILGRHKIKKLLLVIEFIQALILFELSFDQHRKR